MKHDRRVSFLHKTLLAFVLINVLAATALAETWVNKILDAQHALRLCILCRRRQALCLRRL